MASNPVCTKDVVSDYEIIEGGRAIKFSPCGVISHNLNDVRHYYCARCHRFMNDNKLLAARIREGRHEE